MKKILLLLLCLASQAIAADNTVLVTPCASGCVTMRSIDVGTGIQSMAQSLVNSSGTNIIGAGTTVPISGNLTNISGTISLPTGAATAALQTTGNTSLTTINTTLGSPFQAGGALAANQSVNVAQVNGAAVAALNIGTLGTPSVDYLSIQSADPCLAAVKSSASISLTSSTTTSLVAVSGSTTVYVCGFSLTIAPSGTTADSIQFEYGTGAACTSPTVLTGTYGGGDLTTAASVVPVSSGNGGQTIFKSAASAGICAVTAGGTVNIQGVLTYVQQ